MFGGRGKNNIGLISFFASAGGVVDVSDVFSRLPSRFSIPILYHQPVTPSHSRRLMQSLALHTDLDIVWVRDGEKLEAGKIYMCPADYSMLVEGGIVSLVRVRGAQRDSARAQLITSLVSCYAHRCVIVMLNSAAGEREGEVLSRHEKTGVVLSVLPKRTSEKTLGMALPLDDIVPALLKLVHPRRTRSRVHGPRRAGELKEFLVRFLELALRLHGTSMGMIQLYERETSTLRIAVQRGFQGDFLRHFWEVTSADGSVCGRAMQQKRAVAVQDIRDDKDFSEHMATAEAAGFRAVQSTPLITTDGELAGVLSTYFSEPNSIKRSMLRQLSRYTSLAADALPRYTYPGKVGVG